jgi:type I restriction enzyme M protein
LPEHIEKIVRAWETFENIPGFAQVVSREELKKNDDNLNIRRYADNSPPPEPHDVRAHLHGGIPKPEVNALQGIFDAHGLDPRGLLRERNPMYLEFQLGLAEKAALRKRLDADEGMAKREKELQAAVEKWWAKAAGQLADVPNTRALMKVRADLLSTFEKALGPTRLLGEHQVPGVVASWWGEVQNDLKTLAARGFKKLVEAWATGIETALEDEKSKERPLEHSLVRHLLPAYLEKLSDMEAKKAELDAALISDEPDEEGEEEEAESQLPEAELKEKKKELATVKKALKSLRKDFSEQLALATKNLDASAAEKLVLAVMREALDAIIARYVTAHRHQVVAGFERWAEKYDVTLGAIEGERRDVALRLNSFLKELGYGN